MWTSHARRCSTVSGTSTPQRARLRGVDFRIPPARQVGGGIAVLGSSFTANTETLYNAKTFQSPAECLFHTLFRVLPPTAPVGCAQADALRVLGAVCAATSRNGNFV